MSNMDLLKLRYIPLVTNCRFISNGTWFDNNSEAYLIDDYRPKSDCGQFLGIRDGISNKGILYFYEFIHLGVHSE